MVKIPEEFNPSNYLYIPIEKNGKGPNTNPNTPGPTVETWSPEGEGLYTYEEKQQSNWDRWGIVAHKGKERLLILDFDIYKIDDEETKQEILQAKHPETRVHSSQSGGKHLFYLVDEIDLEREGNKAKLPRKLREHIDDKLNGYVVDPSVEGYKVEKDIAPNKIRPDQLPDEWFKEDKRKVSGEKSKEIELTDKELKKRKEKAFEDEKFKHLWKGEYEEAGYEDRSTAEVALAQKIAFWFGRDEQLIRELMDKAQTRKWAERDDESYRSSVIRMIDWDGEEYQPEQDSNTYIKNLEKNSIEHYFAKAIKENGYNPSKVSGNYNQSKHEWTNNRGIKEILKNIDSMKEAIPIMRKRRKSWNAPNRIDKTERKRIIADALKRHIEQYGEFLEDQKTEELYYYNEKDTEVYKVDKNKPTKWQNFLNQVYGLNTSAQSDRFAITQITEHGRRNAKEIKIRKNFHYNMEENKLYVFNREKKYFELDGENIQKHRNGENGIYFQTGTVKGEIEYIPPEEREEVEVHGEIQEFKGKGNIFERIMINRTNFEYKTALDKEQQRKQLNIHLHTIPFYNIMETKPIITFVGEKGSGKSVTLDMIGKFFIRPDFKVTNPPSEKDFTVAVSNSLLLFLDNLDEPKDWMNDMIARISTGAEIRARKLYTDMEEVRRKPECFLGITSRTPEFNRDDVVDRMVLFHVKRFKGSKNLPNRLLYKSLQEQEQYNVLWSQYLDNLNKILREIQSNSNVLTDSTSHRLSDWAVFSKTICNALDIEGRKQLLKDINLEKSTFSLKDDPIKPILDKHLGETIDRGKWFSAGTLYKVLTEIEEDIGVESPNGLGKRLGNIEAELNELYGFKRKYDRGDKVYRYRFKEEGGEMETGKDTDKDIDIDIDVEGKGIQEGIEDYNEDVDVEDIGRVKDVKEKIIDKIKELENEYGEATKDSIKDELSADNGKIEKVMKKLRKEGAITKPTAETYSLPNPY